MQVAELMSTPLDGVINRETVHGVAMYMKQHNRSFVPVFDATHRSLVGVITDKDIVQRVVALNKNPHEIKVSDVMTHDVATIPITATSAEAMLMMQNRGVKRLVVMEHNEVRGVISMNDLIKGMLKYKKKLLDLAIEF